MNAFLFWFSISGTITSGLIRGIDQLVSCSDMKVWLWPFMTAGWCLIYCATELKRQRNLTAMSELIDAYEHRLHVLENEKATYGNHPN